MSFKPYVGASQARGSQDIETVRISIIGNLLFRGTSASKDQRFVNGYFDVLKNSVTNKTHYYFCKRPGLAQNIRPPAGAAVGRGLYSWNGKGYSVFANKIYSGTTDLGVTLTTTTGKVGFAAVRPGATTTYLGINDGAKLYLISTSDAVTTVTTNFPTPNTRDLVYLDGYFFVMKTDGTVWSCEVDDPTTWTPSKFLTAQMYGDAGVGLAHQNNLLIVFCSKSIQTFYDAANALGLPLSNVEQYVQQLGCASRDSIANDEGMVVWVTNSSTGGYSVHKMDGVTTVKEIATPDIQRILWAEGTNIANAIGFSCRITGRLFYILKLIGANRTFVYDHQNDLWVEWETAAGGSAWPVVAAYQHLNVLYCQHATNGYIYTFSPTVYQDDSVNFTVLARLSRVDFDTTRRKFVRRFDIIGDQQSSATLVNLQYSDDDYITLSTARSMDMSYAECFATNLGSFKRRAWQISYAGNNPLRIEAFELRVRMGDS